MNTPKWPTRALPLIGLVGHAGAGKDTVADTLCRDLGFKKIAFADRLREIVSDLFDVPLHYFLDRDKKNTPHPHLDAQYVSHKFSSSDLGRWFEPVYSSLEAASHGKSFNLPHDIAASSIFHNLLPCGPPVTPRRALQLIGTEGFRRLLSDTVWTDCAMARARELMEKGFPVVISDIRFRNEFDAVQASGGQVVGISRPGGEESYAHASETDIALLVGMSDAALINNKTIPDLEAMVNHLGCTMFATTRKSTPKPT